MSLQLHVWGPAFGLESIDAECLAAIAAFRHILHSDDWSLIASNDTSLSPDCKRCRSFVRIFGLPSADQRHRHVARIVPS